MTVKERARGAASEIYSHYFNTGDQVNEIAVSKYIESAINEATADKDQRIKELERLLKPFAEQSEKPWMKELEPKDKMMMVYTEDPRFNLDDGIEVMCFRRASEALEAKQGNWINIRESVAERMMIVFQSLSSADGEVSRALIMSQIASWIKELKVLPLDASTPPVSQGCRCEEYEIDESGCPMCGSSSYHRESSPDRTEPNEEWCDFCGYHFQESSDKSWSENEDWAFRAEAAISHVEFWTVERIAELTWRLKKLWPELFAAVSDKETP